ncbi:tail length tape measure protein [Vibrio phage D472]
MADQDKIDNENLESAPSGAADIFDMSDDDILNMSDTDLNAQFGLPQGQGDQNEDLHEQDDSSEDADESASSDTDEEDSDSGDDVGDTEEDSEGSDESEREDNDAEEEEDESSDADEDDSEEDSSEETNQLEELFKPFKANGREMSVKSVEEARTLMQMGANYNKKMAALKPAFKVAKMLENNKLLDENTVSYLIDLHNGNPDAIKKLIQDKKFDVDDYDGEKDSQYAPTNEHKVTDEELALKDVLTQMRDSDTYEATMRVVGEEWDESSKSKLVANPNMILKLDEHVGNGLYQKISDEIGRQKALGQLTGLSDLDAYFHVGQSMLQNGQLGEKSNQPQQAPTDNKQAQLDKEAQDAKRKAKKRAAKPTKQKRPPVVQEEFNPFEMSDEDFEAQANKLFN